MILDDIVERITGRWALSFKGWFYLTFFGILGTKTRTYALLDITQLESFLLAISVHLINSPIYYFFAHKLFKKRFTEPLSLVSVILSWLLFMAMIAISEILITIYVLNETAYLGPQFFAPLFPSLFGFIASSYLLAEFDKNRKDIQRLAFAQTVLEQTAVVSQEQIITERTQLIAAIQDSVFYQLDALKKQFATLKNGPHRDQIERLANELEDYSTNTIRYLSHEIAEDVSSKSPIDRLSFVGMQKIKSYSNSYHPFISFKFSLLTLVLVGGNHEASLSGLPGFIFQLIATLAVAPILLLGKITTRKYSPGNLYLGFVSFLLTIFVSGYVLVIVAHARVMTNFEVRNQYAPIVFSGRTLAGVILSSLIVTMVEARRKTIVDLVSMNKKLQVDLDWMDSRSRELRRELASILHGPLQGRIAGIAMALRLNAADEDSGAKEKSKKLDEIESLLSTVINDVQELFKTEKSQLEASIVIKLIKLRRSWDGIAAISWSVKPEVFALLPVSSFQVISDVLYDAVSNSVRHGGAKKIDIIFGIDSGNLTLTVKDDGSGIKQEFTPGSGLRKITEVGGTYLFTPGVEQGAQFIIQFKLEELAAFKITS
jgi:signal transduction histidine kinase